MKNALLVIDMINDFVNPLGSLYVPDTEKIVQPIAKCFNSYDKIYFCNDEHDINDTEFDTFPPHAVKGTWGAELVEFDAIISKKNIFTKKVFSAFSNIKLLETLKQEHVKDVTVVGTAIEYCIFSTVSDAIVNGFNVSLDLSLITGINLHESLVVLDKLIFDEECALI